MRFANIPKLEPCSNGVLPLKSSGICFRLDQFLGVLFPYAIALSPKKVNIYRLYNMWYKFPMSKNFSRWLRVVLALFLVLIFVTRSVPNPASQREQIRAYSRSLLGGQSIPPVLYQTIHKSYALIISPRDEIRSEISFMLVPDLTLEEIVAFPRCCF